MKHYLVIIIGLVLICFCDGKDFECSVSSVTNGEVQVEVKNTTTQDIVIMGGDEDSLIRFGILYSPEKDSNLTKIDSIGRLLSMFERPNLILLPAKYSCKFRVKQKKLTEKAQIVHMKIGFDYVRYDVLRLAMKNSDRFPRDIGWKFFSCDLVHNSEAIAKMKIKYSFAWDL